MGRRVAGNGSVSVYQGRFHRTLGKILNDDGEIGPKKFLLGTDKHLAEVANLRLERLWEEVVAEHTAAARWMAEIGGRLGDSDSVAGHSGLGHLRRLDHGPIWRAESLTIAEAIRKGEHQVVVQIGKDADSPHGYLDRFAYLRRTYSVITFVPASMELYVAGQQVVTHEAQELVTQAQELTAQAQVPLPVATGQTLYQALDAYAAFALQQNAKESGQTEARSARRLKDAHPDIPLEQFGISTLERWAAYWSSRPVSKKTNKPVALDTIANHLKTARRFVKWLHRTDAFKWVQPVDATDALRVRVKRLRNEAEIAALSKGVPTWKIEELVTLYRYATDRERLIILLGLNCGFAPSEFCTFRHDEIISDASDTKTVKRIRRKTQVYGEFLLWPQTIVALEWFKTYSGTSAASGIDKEYVMLTETGSRYDRTRLANIWNRLLDRVQKDHPNFRRLSIKYLRKTGGQLVKQQSDGEIAGVFTCHGQPVPTDPLSDVYTNRLFDRVAAALQAVQKDLQPVFDAVPTAFTEKPGSSPNLSLATIEQIQKLHVEGASQAEIARQTGRTAKTVRRWVTRNGSVAAVPD